MPIPLNEYARSLVDARTFATVATINADGSPQTSVVWVRRDGDRILFSTTTGRLKGRNLARDPRVSVTLSLSTTPITRSRCGHRRAGCRSGPDASPRAEPEVPRR
ncbi:MAG TPA: TIGR03618 family F420-dependent PPOX class oxidoreductase [Candidatus Dormibacteraeota bacterium]|jgi:predicted pyridoxine 5'-phosphate oxidase superfamily flavin-nucleotide-binding protein|nr:TIGR03618 family F420-dependent PPOX class oxidoreductase [Candidatus Dormibacteraeota bacterium]